MNTDLVRTTGDQKTGPHVENLVSDAMESQSEILPELLQVRVGQEFVR